MRELSEASVRDQANALLDYLERGGDPDVWIRSKDFAAADLEAIKDDLRRSVVLVEIVGQRPA
jgi:hypothetical protein